nr:hypothetical protein [Bacillus licheniformis]
MYTGFSLFMGAALFQLVWHRPENGWPGDKKRRLKRITNVALLLTGVRHHHSAATANKNKRRRFLDRGFSAFAFKRNASEYDGRNAVADQHRHHRLACFLFE